MRTATVNTIKSVLGVRTNIGVPSHCQFNSDCSVLYFVGYESTAPGASLFRVDLTENDKSGASLSWEKVMGSDVVSGSALSVSEQMVRERRRLGSLGLSLAIYDTRTGQFLVPGGGKLYIVQDAALGGVAIRELDLNEELGVPMDPKWSPEANLISFVREGNLWIYDLRSCQELQLTKARAGCTAGVSEFVMQEEFDRFTGYWWNSTVSSITGDTDVCQILYLETDETMVGEVTLGGPSRQVVKYPRAGEANAEAELCLVSFTSENVIETCKLHPPLKERIPWMEYIVRCGWTPDGGHVWVHVLDRQQQRSALATFAVSDFLSHDEVEAIGRSARLKRRISSQDPSHVIYEEYTQSYRINVSDLTHFLRDGRIIYATELVSGFRNLVLLTRSPDRKGYTSRLLTDIPNGHIDGNLISVDERRQVIFFCGNIGRVLESHLYVISYAEGASLVPIRLTDEGCTHRCTVGSDYNHFVTTFSNVACPPRTEVHRIQWVRKQNVYVPRPKTLHTVASPSTPITGRPLVTPSLFSFQHTSGETLYGALYSPSDLDPNARYPLIIYCYGGPYVQQVTNDYKMTAHLRLQLWVSLGYCVGVIDGRGSSRRGLGFGSVFYGRLGQFEVEEQVQGVCALLERYAFLDPTRVGITGSSYGGYVSLLAIAQRPDIFRTALAGAPVTKWELYDTAYTERFLGTPAENKVGYEQASLISLAPIMPDDHGRVLLVHGLNDENVHFEHTSCLVDALVRANKPYTLLVYPHERHGFRDRAALLHHETEFLLFLQRNL